jgi:hypothetical protein
MPSKADLVCRFQGKAIFCNEQAIAMKYLGNQHCHVSLGTYKITIFAEDTEVPSTHLQPHSIRPSQVCYSISHF